ncbi:transposase [Streptomyces sp. NPDC102274]|uniref:transposase n=1 Tax=Streptomyces sp. NPDC102274 TaxID=3366151 RepID=UPI00381A50BC
MDLPGGEAVMNGGQQRPRSEDLEEHDLTRARIRMAHLLEAETGYRSGSRSWARPDEPRPEYDPERTTLTERRRAKAAELKDLDRQEAKQLGLEWISERTLKRMAAQYDEHGVMGLADGRWTPPLRGRWSISEEVAEAIRAVHAESLHRSKVSMKTKERMIHQYVREKFQAEGQEVDIPHYTTLAKVWKEWFGAEGARQRYIRSAAAVETGKAKVVILRPGQVVALDTTPLPVKVLDDVFGEPISVHLTIALDTYSHSLVAFRLTPVSDSSVEVAMLLRDVLLPLPMRPDWGEELEWPYPGVPAALVAEFAGYRVAGLPFFAPETVTSDHGSVYKNHQIVQVARTLKMEPLPARAMRPQDKAACERAFAGIQSLLLELLLGYRGVDVADRGVDPEGDAVWTLAEMEHLLATWAVAVWQNRPHDGLRHPVLPKTALTPNQMWTALITISGYVPVPLTGADYLELLPVRWQPITERGIRLDYRTYNHDILDPHRSERSPVAAKDGKWEVHHNPHDARQIFVRLTDGQLHEIPWIHRDHVHQPFNDQLWRHIQTEVEQRADREQHEADLADALDQLLRRTRSSAGTEHETGRREQRRARGTAVPLPDLPGQRRPLAAETAPAPEPDWSESLDDLIGTDPATEPGTGDPEGTSAAPAEAGGYGLWDAEAEAEQW